MNGEMEAGYVAVMQPLCHVASSRYLNYLDSLAL